MVTIKLPTSLLDGLCKQSHLLVKLLTVYIRQPPLLSNLVKYSCSYVAGVANPLARSAASQVE